MNNNYILEKNKTKLNDIIKEYTNVYKSWLIASEMTEKEFLKKYKSIGGFKIQEGMFEGNYSFAMTDGDNNLIGEPIVCAFGNDIEEFKLNAQYLLLFICTKLDNANSDVPLFAQRKNYFSDIAYGFCKSLNK